MEYPYSSFPEYLGKVKEEVCAKEEVLVHFKTKRRYKMFVLDNADYQRKIGRIKHLLFE